VAATFGRQEGNAMARLLPPLVKVDRRLALSMTGMTRHLPRLWWLMFDALAIISMNRRKTRDAGQVTWPRQIKTFLGLAWY
jgi:hypothetical protein